jgi:hypothetical protein
MEILIQAIDKATRAGVYTLDEMEVIIIALKELTEKNKKDESNTNE